jgi:hypothetical protein
MPMEVVNPISLTVLARSARRSGDTFPPSLSFLSGTSFSIALTAPFTAEQWVYFCAHPFIKMVFNLKARALTNHHP